MMNIIETFFLQPDIIEIDLNDTLFKNKEEIERAIAALTGKKVCITRWDDPIIALALGVSHKEAMIWAYGNPELQMVATPQPGAVEALIWLKKVGWIINIVTATCMSASQVVSLLDMHKMPFDNIIRTKEKLHPHLTIDDRKEILEERRTLGLETLRFPQPWNIGVDCPSFTWADLEIGAL